MATTLAKNEGLCSRSQTLHSLMRVKFRNSKFFKDYMSKIRVKDLVLNKLKNKRHPECPDIFFKRYQKKEKMIPFGIIWTLWRHQISYLGKILYSSFSLFELSEKILKVSVPSPDFSLMVPEIRMSRFLRQYKLLFIGAIHKLRSQKF